MVDCLMKKKKIDDDDDDDDDDEVQYTDDGRDICIYILHGPFLKRVESISPISIIRTEEAVI